MNILYFITGLGVGGGEIITRNLAHEIQKQGHKVTIVSLTGECMIEMPNDMEVINLRMSKRPISFLKTLWKAKELVKEKHPDIVHANMVHAVLFCRILRLIAKIKVLICTEHTNNIEGGLRMLMYRLTNTLSDYNSNVSQKATDHFVETKAFSKDNAHTIYNGIDLDKYKPNENARATIRNEYKIREDEFVFLNVGRLMPAKDHKNLFEAMSILKHKYDKIKLICVGDGDLKQQLTEELVKKGIDKDVILAGYKENTQDYYNASDCFVLSSRWEGFGLVLAEAMSCKLPTIATNCGGTAEVIQDDKYIVPSNNPTLLSEKMEEMMNMTKEDRCKLGETNKKKAEKFDIKNIARQWLEIYDDLSASRKTRGK